ncbi:hypothetical protein [Zoogloea sp.]|uniref:hypothetical protein n=1 Tax=Zoogloea sp. TaxID=49181 RepID=UPI0035B0396B
MPGLISGLELVEAMISSGEKAVADFFHISGGEWFDEAPEYFLSTYVARSAGNHANTFALLEVPVDITRREAGASRRGRAASHERRNGRFDVVLYWANGNPRAAVEIKSPIWSATGQQIHPDIDRLCSALLANSDSTFQFGAFFFYASVGKPKRKHDNATQRMRDLLARIEEKAIERAAVRGAEAILIPGSVHRGKEDEDGAWSIASLVITRAGGKRSFLTK